MNHPCVIGWSRVAGIRQGVAAVNQDQLIEGLFQALVTGDRQSARAMVEQADQAGFSPEDLSHDVFWPTLEAVWKLYRNDQLTTLAQHYATRLLRSLVAQNQARYTQGESRGRKILMFSGPSEQEELAGQIVADLAEAEGYEIYYAGGGIANDEILAEVGNHRPDVLLMFASAPSDAPNIRVLIDHIREVDACPHMQIVVGGGVFNRAEGLAEEIGADLWATTPRELIKALEQEKERRATPDQRTVGRTRRAGSNQSAAA